MIVKNFGTGTTGAGIAHHPEIVFLSQTRKPIRRDTDFVDPDIGGFIIVVKHRHPQFLFRQAELFGQKGPGKAYGIALEIVTKAEVAQHFKEGVMAGRVPDVLQIVVLATGPYHTLGGYGAAVRPMLLAKKYVFELNHAGVCEQQGWVIPRDQGAALDLGMAITDKIVQKSTTYFCCFHVLLTSCSASGLAA
jgi:hypothetical protein